MTDSASVHYLSLVAHYLATRDQQLSYHSMLIAVPKKLENSVIWDKYQRVRPHILLRRRGRTNQTNILNVLQQRFRALNVPWGLTLLYSVFKKPIASHSFMHDQKVVEEKLSRPCIYIICESPSSIIDVVPKFS